MPTIMGVVGNGKAKKVKGAAKSALLVATDKGDPVANLEAWGDWRMEAFDARSPLGASSKWHRDHPHSADAKHPQSSAP